MSVLIKGIELPESCSDCAVRYEMFCPLRHRFIADEGRRKDCPLVPVPPHGRLIDGDVAEVIHFTEEDAAGKDFYDGILYAADFISKQPTIIPAEEG